MVARLADSDEGARHQALDEICELYWPPVYAFIRCRGKSPADAEDLTQGLFAELLERGDFGRADPLLGKLRTYLLTAATRFLASDWRHQHRQKRGGRSVLLSIDALRAEARCAIPEPVDGLSPDLAFDRHWAISLMEAVVAELAETYGKKDRAELFAAIRPFIQVDREPDNQRDLAASLNMSEPALRVAVHRLRQRYAATLRETVRSTLGPEESVEEELEALLSAF